MYPSCSSHWHGYCSRLCTVSRPSSHNSHHHHYHHPFPATTCHNHLPQLTYPFLNTIIPLPRDQIITCHSPSHKVHPPPPSTLPQTRIPQPHPPPPSFKPLPVIVTCTNKYKPPPPPTQPTPQLPPPPLVPSQPPPPQPALRSQGISPLATGKQVPGLASPQSTPSLCTVLSQVCALRRCLHPLSPQ